MYSAMFLRFLTLRPSQPCGSPISQLRSCLFSLLGDFSLSESGCPRGNSSPAFCAVGPLAMGEVSRPSHGLTASLAELGDSGLGTAAVLSTCSADFDPVQLTTRAGLAFERSFTSMRDFASSAAWDNRCNPVAAYRWKSRNRPPGVPWMLDRVVMIP